MTATKDRLAFALREIGLDEMADLAATGHHDEYDGPLVFPISELVRES
jgi:hypothetical protein